MLNLFSDYPLTGMGFLKPFVTVVILSLISTVTRAQAPTYTGALLIQPGSNAGKCLTPSSNFDGASVFIQPCVGSDAQKWLFQDGTVRVFGDKCLDVIEGVNMDGTKLQIWTCSTMKWPNQQFVYNIWDNHLIWSDRGKCLDLTEGNVSDGALPQIWTCGDTPNQVWKTGYFIDSLPITSQNGQFGTNNCGPMSRQDANCQTAWINSVDDFCLWAPPNPNSTIGDTERIAITWCTRSGRGTRTIPDGTLGGVHFVRTQDYVQITGVGDFQRINVRAGDAGGELDPHGADGNGNPIGGLLYGSTFGPNLQYHEWTQFISDTVFCIRACIGPNAGKNCEHIYDIMGCYWNMPGNYGTGVFESCVGDNTEPMGIYGASTWYQGVNPTPPPHPPGPSSNCVPAPSVSVAPA